MITRDEAEKKGVSEKSIYINFSTTVQCYSRKETDN